MQSNETSMSDDELEFIVAAVQNGSGGNRKSIDEIPFLSEKHVFCTILTILELQSVLCV